MYEKNGLLQIRRTNRNYKGFGNSHHKNCNSNVAHVSSTVYNNGEVSEYEDVVHFGAELLPIPV